MKGYIGNIEKLSEENTTFRTVLYTDKNLQLVVMSLNPNEDIGEEVHQLDQFIRIEKGTAQAVLDGVTHELTEGAAIIIPSGIKHNLINTSNTEALKLYTLYSPPNHADGTVHETRAEAMAAEEHFDGKTTE